MTPADRPKPVYVVHNARPPYTLLPGFEDAAASGVVEGIIDVSQATTARVTKLEGQLTQALAALSYLTRELNDLKAKQIDDRKDIATVVSEVKGEKGLVGRMDEIDEFFGSPEEFANKVESLDQEARERRRNATYHDWR